MSIRKIYLLIGIILIFGFINFSYSLDAITPIVELTQMTGYWKEHKEMPGKKRIVQIFNDGRVIVKLWYIDEHDKKERYREESQKIARESLDELIGLIRNSKIIDFEYNLDQTVKYLKEELRSFQQLQEEARKDKNYTKELEERFFMQVIKPRTDKIAEYEAQIRILKGEKKDIDTDMLLINIDGKIKNIFLGEPLGEPENNEVKGKLFLILEEIAFLASFNDYGCCCGGGGQYFWVDMNANKIIGIEGHYSDPCSSSNAYHYLGEDGIDWKNQESIDASSYLSIQRRKFEPLVNEYNTKCNGCLKKIPGFIGE